MPTRLKHQHLGLLFYIGKIMSQGLEILYASAISIFSPLPFNSMEAKSKLDNTLYWFITRIKWSQEREILKKSITSAHPIHEIDVCKSLRMAWLSLETNKASGWIKAYSVPAWESWRPRSCWWWVSLQEWKYTSPRLQNFTVISTSEMDFS